MMTKGPNQAHVNFDIGQSLGRVPMSPADTLPCLLPGSKIWMTAGGVAVPVDDPTDAESTAEPRREWALKGKL